MPNIFVTHDNLVLASPLIALCTIYGFFCLVPLIYGVPFIGAIALAAQVRNNIIASRSTNEHIDKTIVKDLISDEDAIIAKLAAKEKKKQRKAEQKLIERLKEDKKNATREKDILDDDDEGGIIDTFVKSPRGKMKAK